ncbi:response regulator transcription factor [Ilumatobacter coccineus]|uniref:Putative OmpR family two-component response regulator n=1 Tax=Ilumatobacter coccineus (strain NBRC 103263 / KCTC 29153 / YM16-304) TaxID=1313172 RepID=A0A6C7E2K5_ILUCY|nr:response regulator transcription factor [Ilumatobacter coccineus]BAN01013.1 putative OmpR family two-component response regulator [Ilumatobacter coccineus YM16-304]
MTRILIAEDEERIVSFLEKGLKANGYTTIAVGTGTDAIALARDDTFDLLILDLGLPGADGHEVLRQVRGRGERMPIIVLTARSGVDDTVGALEGGADDHVAKPFRFEELLARIRLRLRDDSTDDAGAPSVLTVGDVRLDLRARTVSSGDRVVELTAREFSLMETFMRNPGRVLSRMELLSSAWGYDFDPNSNVVDVYVRYLRNKLTDDTIETVRGAGYRLRA